MQMDDASLVTVVIPVYNGAVTIAETLRSVLDQSHRLLEVIIIDDGSTDGTLAAVVAEAGGDPRVMLIEQRNQGVATARNAGIARASGSYIAFLDADDIWFEHKLAKQLQALRSAGSRAGLCYCGYVEIDDAGNRRNNQSCPTISGNVLRRLCGWNFVGNGSSLLVRREALDVIGGFDPSLRDRGAQGCEDYDLLLRLADRYEFAVVPEILVGYRIGTQSMSADFGRMIRSWCLVCTSFGRVRPDVKREMERGSASYAAHLFVGAARRARFAQCLAIVREMRNMLGTFAWALLGAGAKRLGQAAWKSRTGGGTDYGTAR